MRFASFALLTVLMGCGPSDAEQAKACAKGVPLAESDPAQSQCNFLTDNRCFEDSATACVCAGCSSDCAIDESFPAVPACN